MKKKKTIRFLCDDCLPKIHAAVALLELIAKDRFMTFRSVESIRLLLTSRPTHNPRIYICVKEKNVLHEIHASHLIAV